MAKIIKGKKGGSSKKSSFKESPDSLISTSYAKVLLAICEGETYGEVTAKDIYLDGTPCVNPDGSENFKIEFDYRNGTQDQSYIQGMPESSNEITVDTEITHNTPWVKTITNTDLSAIRIRLKWPALLQQHDDGVSGYIIKYKIELSVDGDDFETVLNASADGKTTSGYERSHRINLPQDASFWTIRVKRLTDNNSSVKISDTMKIASYTEIIDAKLTYPHTSLLYIKFDASNFNGSIPQISVLRYGRIVRVPSNYDPFTRKYTGVWDGTFKWAWTNNPAWVMYDLISNDRFGLGDRIKAENLDRYEFYTIAQYCDELISDGKGGKQPRHTCNVYIQNRNDAYTVLRDFAAIFRGMTYWYNNKLCVIADMPRDTDYIYTRANVIDGLFSYSSSTTQARYTSALVSYSDPENQYKDAVEPVFEKDLITRYKTFNQLEITAIGCTNQAEANQKGRWAILTNNKDRAVTFKVGLDGMIPLPGYIVGVADQYLSGKILGGRISDVDGKTITLDRVPDALPNDTLIVNLPSGKAEERTIKSIYENKIMVVSAFSETPEKEAVWSVESTDVFIQRYRVVSIKNNDDNTFTITGVYYDPDKFERIDNGAIIDTRPISVVPSNVQSPPSDIEISATYSVIQGLSVATLHAEWNKPEGANHYEVQWRKDSGNWINASKTSVTSLDIEGIYSGIYEVRVCAVNSIGVTSQWKVSDATELLGKVGTPDKPINLMASDNVLFGIELNWNFPPNSGDSSYTEIQYATTENSENILLLSNVAYPTSRYTQTGLGIGQRFCYRARLVDKIGNVSDWTDWVFGIASNNTSDLTDHIFDEIKNTDAWKQLNNSVESSLLSTNEQVEQTIKNAKAIIQNALANDADVQRWRVEAGNNSAEIAETKQIIVNEKEAIALAMQELNANMGDISSSLTDVKVTQVKQGEELETLSLSMSELDSSIDDAKSNIIDLQQTVVTQGDSLSSLAESIQQSNANIDSVNANSSVTSMTQAQAIIKNALANDDESVKRREEDGKNGQEIQVVAQAVTKLNASLDDANSEIVDLKQVTVTHGERLETQSQSITQLSSSLNDVNTQTSTNATAIHETNTKVSQQGEKLTSQASQITELSTEIGDVSTKVSDVANAVQDTEGKLSAYRTLKIEVDGNGKQYVAGMSMGVEQTSEGTQSNVIFLADNFAVMNGANGEPIAAFIIKDGNVIINSAVIGDATLNFAKISDSIQSDNFIEGKTGWKLYKNGNFEINGTFDDLDSRVLINNKGLNIFDENGKLKVEIGKLNG